MKIKSLFYLICLAAFVAFCFSGCDSTKETDVLKIGMELQFPPFEMADGNGNPTGISVDMAKDLGKYLNRPVEIENISWTGLIPSLQTNKVDLVISSMSITPSRKKVVDFSIPYAQSGLTLLINRDSPVTNWSNLDKKGNIIAVKSGTIGAVIAKDKIINADVRYFDEAAACVLEVSQGKADAFIYDAITVFENHKKHPETTRYNLQNIPETASPWAIVLKKGNTELKKKVDAFIIQYREQGKFEVLEKKYLKSLKAAFTQANVPSFFQER